MNISLIFRTRRRFSLIFALFMIAAVFSLGVQWQTIRAQSRLTLAEVLTGLTSTSFPLEERNRLLTDAVNKRGVTFKLSPEIEKELVTSGASAILLNAIRQKGPDMPTLTPNSKPSAAFKNIRVDYDIKEGTQLGMRVYVSFTTYQMKNIPGYLAIYFLDSKGNNLKDRNQKIYSSTGDVAVYRELTPAYDPAEFNDFSIFMPYAELDLSDGNWNLTMDVKLIYKAGGMIQQLTKKDFNYKQGDVVKRDQNSITSKVNRVWVDYNVTQGGKRGMLVHVNFEVTGLQGIDSKLVARVQKENGDYILNSNSANSNDSGELQIAYALKPGYSTSVYKDATMFLPYSEINITKGVWNLKLDIDLNYDDDELIQHLDFYEFEFDRP